MGREAAKGFQVVLSSLSLYTPIAAVEGPRLHAEWTDRNQCINRTGANAQKIDFVQNADKLASIESQQSTQFCKNLRKTLLNQLVRNLCLRSPPGRLFLYSVFQQGVGHLPACIENDFPIPVTQSVTCLLGLQTYPC